MLKINLEADINNISFLDYMQRCEEVRKEKLSPENPEEETDNTGNLCTHTRIYL